MSVLRLCSVVVVPSLQGRINQVYISIEKEKIQNDTVNVRFYNSISKQLSKLTISGEGQPDSQRHRADPTGWFDKKKELL
jgi:hypothetical protein